MRLKGQKLSQNALSNRSLERSESDVTRNGDLLNGSSASCSSASAIGTQDDLDNAIDSADDEIDVGTNADSIEYNGNSANTSAALSGINNDHQFGLFNSQSLNFSSGMNQQSSQSGSITEADRKRAHHNALERKRRDHIKDSFHTLRDAIPNIKGEKTSRAQILKAATDYIRHMRTRNIDYQNDIEIIKKQNNDIENQIKQLERAKQTASHLLRQQQSNQNDPNINDGDVSDDLDDYKFDLHENKASLAAIVAAVTSSTTAVTNNPNQQLQPMTTSSNKQINYSNILNQKLVHATSTPSSSSASAISSSSSSFTSPASSMTATPIKLNYSNLINQKLLTTTTTSGNQKVVTTMSSPTTHAKFTYSNVINQHHIQQQQQQQQQPQQHK